MSRFPCRRACGFVAVVLLLSGPAVAWTTDDEERKAERARVAELMDQALPEVGRLLGLDSVKPVKMDVTTRNELQQYLLRLIEERLPPDELERRGRSLAMLGLLPDGYDLEAGVVALLRESAGAYYDPYSKTFFALLDLEPALKNPATQKIIVAHELTHALQHRQVDLIAHQDEGISDLNANYAFGSVLEGMASVVMMAYLQGTPVTEVTDVRAMWRGMFEGAASDSESAFGGAPLYVRESLASPYAEGAAFVQAWLDAHPEARLVDLFKQLPRSAEQILHYDKYAGNDSPSEVSLEEIEASLPREWSPYYENTLGEFEVRMLCLAQGLEPEEAEEIAAGWDGIRFRVYRNRQDELLVVGGSAWDSEQDAAEFESVLRRILAGLHPEDAITVRQEAHRVLFMIGQPGERKDAP